MAPTFARPNTSHLAKIDDHLVQFILSNNTQIYTMFFILVGRRVQYKKLTHLQYCIFYLRVDLPNVDQQYDKLKAWQQTVRPTQTVSGSTSHS